MLLPQQGHDVVSGSITISDPRQVRRQRFAPAGLGPRAQHRRSLFRRCLLVRARDLAFFECELQLVGVEPLRVPTKLRSLELPDDVVHPLDPEEQFVALGEQRQRCGSQARNILRKRIGRRHRDPDSTTIRRS